MYSILQLAPCTVRTTEIITIPRDRFIVIPKQEDSSRGTYVRK